ncbi:hypothetical protein HU200_051853 [Digitaria exilis]|uniref:Uncharacterized protein n=1 Tax=Digitaria exilis TaxID=1010633 RepID=A0A835AJR1_9POAL|nr:hypothetical protein HU200_051853 [Digitaria exilis]
MHCFPAGDRRVICADQSGSCYLVDAKMRHVVTMPHLHKPKSLPLSLFVPSTDDHNGGSLFVMDSALEPEAGGNGQLSHQFEALVYRKQTPIYPFKSWDSQPLPPPPFVCDPKYSIHNPPKIRSYAVVSGGSHICISVEGAAGSYFLDTESYTWSHERSWTLPFHGKVEYVPELKLWFGLSAKDQTLAAADLSDMDSQPQLVGTWRKEVNLPEEWRVSQDPQLVNLGSGRFCITRFFFHAGTLNGDRRDEQSDRYCVVLTGVEVTLSRVHHTNANGDRSSSEEKVDFQMITHKSRRHTSNGTDDAIRTVF